MILRSFQPRSCIAALQADGLLVGSWDRVSGGPVRRGYEEMVAAMATAGIDTGGRPPIWAWHGPVHLIDAHLLLAEHELRNGSVTVEFDAPAELVAMSDYGAWNEHLAALLEQLPSTWDVGSLQPGGAPVQACVPHLLAEWVREIRPLPTTGWEELDLDQPI